MLPSVVRAVPIAPNLLEVEFSTGMENNDDIRNPDLYTFSGGLVARSVQMVAHNKVRIYVVPDMAKDQLYGVNVFAYREQTLRQISDSAVVTDELTGEVL